MKFGLHIIVILSLALSVHAQTTAFTYQGKLSDAGSPANGDYDLRFRLYDQQAGGTQIGSDIFTENVSVAAGIFTVSLDFGASPFLGASGDRYLEISVRPGISNAAHTTLTPRQMITSSPYAIQTVRSAAADSLSPSCVNCVNDNHISNVDGAKVSGSVANAATASNSLQLGGTAANQFVQNSDPRLSDARQPIAGNANYIQNGTSQQSSTDFNISGSGTAGGTLSGNAVNTESFFSINSIPLLKRSFSGNRLFLGENAGNDTATGFNLIAIGNGAGLASTSGNQNLFVGSSAGAASTTGDNNTFIGASSGINNTTASQNTFVGFNSGGQTTTGQSNAFFGYSSGPGNSTGVSNAFFGALSGFGNSTGGQNAFFGYFAGLGNGTGTSNSAFGSNSGFASPALQFATAIGSGAQVAASNTVQLGRSNGADSVLVPGSLTVTGTLNATIPVNSTAYILNGTNAQASSNFNISGDGVVGGNFSAGTVTTGTSFKIGVNRVLSNSGTRNLFAGAGAAEVGPTGTDNAFYGAQAGFAVSTGAQNTLIGSRASVSLSSGSDNTFVGFQAGGNNLTGSGNTVVGSNATTGLNNHINATAIGYQSRVEQDNSLVLGSIQGVNGAANSTNVGIGTTTPSNRLHVIGNSTLDGDLTVTGTLNGTVTNAQQLAGVAASQYVQTTDPRLSDPRAPTAGSGNYIQNGTGGQAASFNVTGTGVVGGSFSAGTVESSTHFSTGGVRAFGILTGGNTVGGSQSGAALSGGTENSLFGAGAGVVLTSGVMNTFLGHSAGLATVGGGSNSFVGWRAGFANTSGSNNTFVGRETGFSNTSGANNTLVGMGSDVAPSVSNSSAVGFRSRVTVSNALVLGGINGVNGASANTSVGVGTTAPSFRFHVRADGLDGIKIQHTGSGTFPQLRWTDSADANKGSIAVDTTGPGSMRFSLNGTERMVIENSGLVRAPGGVFIANPNTVMITAPNGTCWGITVSNTGVLSTFPVSPCP